MQFTKKNNYFKSGSIFPADANKSWTDFIEFSKFFFSSSLKLSSTIFSTPFDQIITLPSSVDEVYTKGSVVTQGDARGTVLKDTHGPDVTVTVTADFFRKGEVVVGDKTLEITSVRVPGNSQGDEMTLFDKMKNFVRNHLPLSIGVVVFLIIFMIIVIVYFKNKKRS